MSFARVGQDEGWPYARFQIGLGGGRRRRAGDCTRKTRGESAHQDGALVGRRPPNATEGKAVRRRTRASDRLGAARRARSADVNSAPRRATHGANVVVLEAACETTDTGRAGYGRGESSGSIHPRPVGGAQD